MCQDLPEEVGDTNLVLVHHIVIYQALRCQRNPVAECIFRELKKSSLYRTSPAEPPLHFARLRLSWVLASQCPASLKGVGVPLITVWPRTTAWLPSAGIRPCFRGISLKPFPASLPKTGPASCSTKSTQFRGMRVHAWQLLSRRRAPQLHAYLQLCQKLT